MDIVSKMTSALDILNRPVGHSHATVASTHRSRWRCGAAALVLLSIACAGAVLWRSDSGASPQQVAQPGIREPASAAVVTARPAARITAAGFIKTEKLATVSADVTGTVEAIYVKRGDLVKQGERLASLDSARLRSDLDAVKMSLRIAQNNASQARERLPLIEANFKRLTELSRWGAVSSQELENLQSELTARKAEVQRLELEARYAALQIERKEIDLERSIIRAPFDGMIVSLDAAIGEIVSPVSSAGGFARTGIATLIDTNNYHAEAWVPEKALDKLVERQVVNVIPDALGDTKAVGEVTYISPIVDEQRAAVLVLIKMQAAPASFKHNMAVHVDFL
jgi:HlyD family secretion protein